jgi:hypothetical protein
MTAHIRVDNNIDNLESHCKSRNSNIPIEVNTTWINMISQFKIINNMLIQHHIIYIYDLVCSCTRDLSPAQNTSIKNSCEYPASERHHFHADKIYAENDRFQLQMLGFARRFAGVLNCFLVGCASCLRPQPFHAYDLENKWIGHCSRKHIFFHFKDVYI